MLLSNQKKNRGLKHLSLAYAHYTWFEKDDFVTLLQAILIGLNENDYMDIKPYLALITQLVLTPGGDRVENRFDKTLSHFLEIMSENIGFYRFTEACVEFLFKLMAGVPSVLQWFLHNRDKWAFLIEWQTKYSFPIDQTGPNRLYKRRTNQYTQYPQYMRNEAYKNQFLRDARLERFKMILKNPPQIPGETSELESWLVDMEDYKFKHGEQFEFYYRKTDTVSIYQVE
jgi:hypothetical protein